MSIENDHLQSLYASLCEKQRQSPLQSHDAIVRDARRQISLAPNHGEARHLLAAKCLVHRQLQDCLTLLSTDTNSFSGDPIGNRIAGYASLLQGQLDLAHRYFSTAVSLDPSLSDCWTQLGHLAVEKGAPARARDCYERAMLFHDWDQSSAIALAKLHCQQHDLRMAIQTLRVAVLRERRSPKLNFALAKMLNRRARQLARRKKNPRAQQRIHDEALGCYQVANASAPTAHSLTAQGLLEQRAGKFDQARACFERAVRLDPNSSLALTNLANANVERGHIDEALVQFQQALAISPSRAATHFRYSRTQKFKPGDESEAYASRLRELLNDSQLARVSRMHLHFSLAKVLDDLKQFDEAWWHYDQANRLKPGHSRSLAGGATPKLISEPPLQQLADDSLSLLTREFFLSHPAMASQRREFGNDETPIFIVGMPRSGTTLTEQILSSHPDIAGGGELRWIDKVRQEMSFHYRQRLPGVLDSATLYPQLLGEINPAEFDRYAEVYLTRLMEHRTVESRVTDKMPTNFVHLGLIALLFPRATIIHCRRHPMDVMTSCFCQNLNAPFCDFDQLVGYHRNYRRLMSHWEKVLPLKICTVDYEQMVADPEGESKRLVAHCGLPWDDRCLHFQSNARVVHTPSKWQVRQPMYATSVEKWRRFERQLAPFAEQLERELADSLLSSAC